MPHYQIYTDGSYTGKTRAGGYAAMLVDSTNTPIFCVSGRMDDTTNNVMELEALRQAIILATSFKASSYKSIKICTDSMYALNATTNWARGWIRNGWKTKDGKDISNKDLIEDIYYHWLLARKDKIEIVKVKAHATCYWNNVVDGLAKAAREGKCGECFTRTGYSGCKICRITRAPDWLAENVPTLRYLKRNRI